MSLNIKNITSFSHHEQRETCALRPRYRQGRRDTAVKVYTINLESPYLLLTGVPSVGVKDELETKCGEFGDLVHFYVLDEYPCEDFTEVYLVCYAKLQSARVAKRKLDSQSFFGRLLHVCFAPEYETVEETRNKLVERQKYVAYVTGKGDCGPFRVRKPQKRDEITSCSSSLTSPTSNDVTSGTEQTYIWAGKTYTMPQPQLQSEQPNPPSDPTRTRKETTHFVPRQLRTTTAASKTKREEEDSSESTSSWIRSKIASLSAPNPIVSFKKRKT